MKKQQKPTEAQADIIRQTGLDPETVTVTTKSAVPPLAITYHGEGRPLPYWIYSDNGALRLTDTKPTPAIKGECDESQPRETVDTASGPDQKAEILLSGKDPDIDHGPERGEIEAALRAKCLSKNDTAVVLAVACDHLDKQAAIACETRLNRKTVAAILRNPRVKRCLQELQRGSLLTGDAQSAPRENTLPGLLARLREALADERQAAFNYRTEETRGYPVCHVFELSTKARSATYRRPSRLFAKQVIECIRDCPSTITKGTGLLWAGALEDLLKAAKYGDCDRLVPGLLPEGKGDHVRTSARKALALLTGGRKGNPLEYDSHAIRQAFGMLYTQLGVLQREYQATTGQRTIAERLGTLREAHGDELNGFSDAALHRILNRDTLAAAIELAANTTGISPKYWHDLARREIKATTPAKA